MQQEAKRPRFFLASKYPSEWQKNIDANPSVSIQQKLQFCKSKIKKLANQTVEAIYEERYKQLNQGKREDELPEVLQVRGLTAGNTRSRRRIPSTCATERTHARTRRTHACMFARPPAQCARCDGTDDRIGDAIRASIPCLAQTAGREH